MFELEPCSLPSSTGNRIAWERPPQLNTAVSAAVGWSVWNAGNEARKTTLDGNLGLPLAFGQLIVARQIRLVFSHYVHHLSAWGEWVIVAAKAATRTRRTAPSLPSPRSPANDVIRIPHLAHVERLNMLVSIS
jgi:hypothetical protein